MTDRRPRGGLVAVLWWPYAVVRTLYCWVALAILTIGLAMVYVPSAAIGPNSRLVKAFERFWVWFILRGSNVGLRDHGLENVVPGRSYIVMANHRSMYDIPALHYLLGKDRDLRWIGKHEMLRVPFFGWAFALSRHIAIDRQNRNKSIAALKEAAANSVEGVSFVIMPEGTRSTNRRLAPFKKGGFHLAIDTGLPVLPVAIMGTEQLMRKGEWWILPGSIDVFVGPPVKVGDYDKSRLEEFRQRVWTDIRDALTDLPAEAESGAA